jgi:hypothetical protein
MMFLKNLQNLCPEINPVVGQKNSLFFEMFSPSEVVAIGE